jgi:hypothetical protein
VIGDRNGADAEEAVERASDRLAFVRARPRQRVEVHSF